MVDEWDEMLLEIETKYGKALMEKLDSMIDENRVEEVIVIIDSLK